VRSSWVHARVRAVALGGALALAPPAVAGGPGPFRFDYERGPGAEACAPAPVLRAAVRERLGREIFRDEAEDPTRAPEVIVARVERLGTAYVGRFQLRDRRGQTRVRELRATADCAELVLALALAISIAVDPLSLTGPEPARPEPARPEPARPEPARPEPSVALAAARPPEPPLEPELAAGIRVAPGWAPGLAPTAVLAAGCARARLSLRAELAYTFASAATITTTSDEGQVSVSALSGGLVPCWGRRDGEACLVATVGIARGGATGFDWNRSARLSFAAAGLRLGYAPAVAARFGVRVYADALLRVKGTAFLVDERVAWRTPPVSFGGGLELVRDLP
jgi:hypothetical protein